MNRRSLLALSCSTLLACSAPPVLDGGADSATRDAVSDAAGESDAASMDARIDDAAATDSGSLDATGDASAMLDGTSADSADSAADATLDAVNVDVSADAGRDSANESAVDSATDSASAVDARADVAADVARVCTPMATRSCYSGSAATRGVGACRDGVETCAADGSGWGACSGEVLPSMERCSTVADEDCDGAIAVCAPSLAAFQRGMGAQTPRAVAVDSSGNVAIGGQFTGSMDLGAGPVVANGTDGFVAIYSSTGALRALVVLEGAGNADVRALSFDSAGNVYVGGSFTGLLNPGGAIAAGGNDAFAMKLSSVGALQWFRRFGDASNQEALAIAAGADRVVLAGRFAGSFSGTRTHTSTSSANAFAVVLDLVSGAPTDSASWGDTGTSEATAVAVNGTSIVIAGNFTNRIDLGAGPLTGGASSAFVAKFGATLAATQWAQPVTASTSMFIRGASVNASGVVTIAGEFTGATTTGPSVLTSGGSQDVYVARLAADGVTQWHRRFGAAGSDRALAVSSTSTGEALVGGAFASAVTFGPSAFPGGMLTAPGTSAGFLLKTDNSGAVLWARSFTMSGDSSVDAVACASDGSSIFAGSFAGSVDFAPAGSATSAGMTDSFVARVAQ